MENLQKELEKEILNLQRSFFFGKRPMSLCFEIKETTEEVAKKWLSIVDSILEIHFVQKYYEKLVGAYIIFLIKEQLLDQWTRVILLSFNVLTALLIDLIKLVFLRCFLFVTVWTVNFF